MQFIVKTRILKDGKTYEPGTRIDLTAEEAWKMPWAVQAPAVPAKRKEDNAQ